MDDDVYEHLKQIFPDVDPEILQSIANEHGDDMDAATTAVVGDIEYDKLRLIFPMVDVDILKAISSEYRNDLETAIKTVIDEVVDFIPGLHNNNQNNHQSPVDESVDHRILKEVFLNRKYNLDAPIEVVMDNSVFEQLKDIFPLVDDEILRAIADEHSDNADVAIDDILHQVVPYTQNDTDGSNGPEIDQEEFSFGAAETSTGDSSNVRGLSANVLESAVQSEADEMTLVNQFEGLTHEEAKVGEDSAC